MQPRSIAPHGQALVTKHNKLIQARYALSLQEKRLILWLVSAIRPGDTDFHSYRVSVRTLAELLGLEKNKNIYAELEVAGSSPLAVRRQLVAEGVAKCFSDELRGFTKVGGNEFNALLVYSALLRITELTPAKIALNDEGEFLLASLILQRGKAKLDTRDMERSWAYWEKQGFLKDDSYGCRTKMEAQQALFAKYGTKL